MGFRTPQCLAAITLVAALLTTDPAAAQQTSPSAPVETAVSSDQIPNWQRAFYKAVTYQAMGNIADFLFYRALIGGTPAMTGSFVVVNAVTGFSLYYGYEYAWSSAVPQSEDRAVPGSEHQQELRAQLRLQRKCRPLLRLRRQYLHQRHRYFPDE